MYRQHFLGTQVIEIGLMHGILKLMLYIGN